MAVPPLLRIRAIFGVNVMPRDLYGGNLFGGMRVGPFSYLVTSGESSSGPAVSKLWTVHGAASNQLPFFTYDSVIRVTLSVLTGDSHTTTGIPQLTYTPSGLGSAHLVPYSVLYMVINFSDNASFTG